MKMKAILALHFTLIIALAVGTVGCMCTNAVLNKCNQTTVHTFSNPFAIYQKVDQNAYALEGLNHNYNSITNHAYLIILPEEVVTVDPHTNRITSLADLKQLQHALEQSHGIPYQSGIEVKRKLPSGYQKIADLPQNDVGIYVGESQPAWPIILLPVTVVADLATFPFQFFYVATHLKM